MLTIKDIITALRELKNKNADKSEALDYAINFIKKHNRENVIKYKDYNVTVFFSEKHGMLYGKAVNPNDPKYIVLVNGNSVTSFIEDFRNSIDTLKAIEKNNFELGVNVVEMVEPEEKEPEESANEGITENNQSDQEQPENDGQNNDPEREPNEWRSNQAS